MACSWGFCWIVHVQFGKEQVNFKRSTQATHWWGLRYPSESSDWLVHKGSVGCWSRNMCLAKSCCAVTFSDRVVIYGLKHLIENTYLDDDFVPITCMLLTDYAIMLTNYCYKIVAGYCNLYKSINTKTRQVQHTAFHSNCNTETVQLLTVYLRPLQ